MRRVERVAVDLYDVRVAQASVQPREHQRWDPLEPEQLNGVGEVRRLDDDGHEAASTGAECPSEDVRAANRLRPASGLEGLDHRVAHVGAAAPFGADDRDRSSLPVLLAASGHLPDGLDGGVPADQGERTMGEELDGAGSWRRGDLGRGERVGQRARRGWGGRAIVAQRLTPCRQLSQVDRGRALRPPECRPSVRRGVPETAEACAHVSRELGAREWTLTEEVVDQLFQPRWRTGGVSEFVQQDADGEEVCRRSERLDLAPALLWRHVAGRAGQTPGLEAGPKARKPQVREPDTPWVQQHVRRLDVAVEDLLGVEVRQRREQLVDPRDELAPAAVERAQRAIGKRHGQEQGSVELSDLEHGHQRRVREARGQPLLLAEAGSRPRVVHAGAHALERHLDAQKPVERHMDGAHPAFAQEPAELESTGGKHGSILVNRYHPTMVRIDVIVTRTGSSWCLAVGDGSSRAERADIPAATVDRLVEAARALGRPAGGFHPDDSHITAREEAFGRRLGELLKLGPPRFWRLLGRAEREGAVVIVDAPDLREVPWELLADEDGFGLEATGRAVIARAATAGHAQASTGRGIGWWTPTPDDPVCATRIGGPCPERPAVLHVVCHGRADAERMVVELADQDLAVGTVGHVLAPRLTGCCLVVLEVCEAASARTSELDSLASRLIAAGASACLAPASELAVEAAAAAGRTLHAQLTAGSTVVDAVLEARRAVRELALPYPDARWYQLQLHCGVYRALEIRPVLPAPDGLPAADDDVRAVVDRAVQIAHEDALGFVGFEHLIEALGEGRHEHGGLRGLALLTRPLRAQHRGRRDALVAVETANLGLTPRLLAADFRDGFNADDVCAAMLATGPLEGRTLPGSDSATIADQSEVRPATPARALEVQGGPEDGRVLRPAEGDVIGRHSTGTAADITLYRRTSCTDPGLSRNHLRWLADGRMEALKRTTVDGVRARGVFDVRIGDRVRVGLATVLRGIA